MDTVYKGTTLTTIKRELTLSLQLYSSANDPYQLRNIRKKQLSPRHRDTLYLGTLKHSQSKLLGLYGAKQGRKRFKRQDVRSVPRKVGLLRNTPLKVRRNHQNRDFTAYFQKHQILGFFGRKHFKYRQLHHKKVDKQTIRKQIIKDVFFPLEVQFPQKTTLEDTKSQVAGPKLGTEYEKLKIDGWSYKTIQRLVLQDQPRDLSQSSVNTNTQLPNSQKQHQTSIKSLFPVSSIAIIPPSSTTCNRKPASLFYQKNIANKQPSIKCVSSSDQPKYPRIIAQDQGTDYPLPKTVSKQPSVRSIDKFSTIKPNILQIQRYLESRVLAKDIVVMQQFCDLTESIPGLNTLHSHFDSHRNIDFTQQNKQSQSQKGIHTNFAQI